MGSYRICVCFRRSFGTANLQPPTDIVDAFKKYTAGSGSLTSGRYMNAEELRRFLVEEQALTTTTTIEDAEKVIEAVLKRRHHHHYHLGMFNRRNELSLDDFMYLLFSVDLNPPINTRVHQDMTAPLSHYFIYTGHNSYLTGNQLSSDCSDGPIIMALQRGVRVIELDLWPNRTEDDVHVLHGRTLTRPVTLIKCLISIKNHAFSVSPYPVILTLEDHLTPDLQAKVAQMLIETFQDMLFYPETESHSCAEFPSPEELKGRVIISTKPPKEYLTTQNLMEDKGSGVAIDNSQKGKDFHHGHVSDKALLAQKEHDASDQGHGIKVECEGSDPDQVVESGDDHKLASEPPGYKRVIAIPAKRRGKVLDDSLKMDPNQAVRLSLSEQALEKAAISHGTQVVRFTQSNILRVFPKTTRFDSSNYNPLVGWMHGAQMVAFNMQGFGKWLWLMHGMFKANGGCGYVKKPSFLIKLGPDGNEVFNPKSNLTVKRSLKVKVYMGDGWQSDFRRTHFDSYSPPDFYVKVGIAGVPADEIMMKTKIKHDQWSPVWEEEFIFPLTVPELALLRIQVLEYDMSEKDDFGGQTCLPVSELKPGIHAVSLYDHKGEMYPSVKLLMRFLFI